MGFAAGFSSGANAVNMYNARIQQEKENERQAKLDAQNSELHTARMADIAENQRLRKEAADNKLSDAAAYAEPKLMQSTIEAQGPAMEGEAQPTMQQYKVSGKSLPTIEDANTFLVDQSKLTPAQRLAANQVATGRVAESMSTVAGDIQRSRADTEWKQKQDEIEKKIKSEGLIETADAAVSGDAQRVFEAFNKQGAIKLDAPPKMTKRTINLPGFGNVDSWDIEGTITGPNGENVPFKKNSHDMAMAIMPYKQRLEVQNKGVETTSRAELRLAQAENQSLRNSIAAARSGGGSGGGASSIPGVALKDRRDYLSDFSGSLPDPKTAATPEEAQTISAGNQRVLAQADAVFSTNAELGNILTAPQAAAAMRLAQDPANIKRVRDNKTGIVYETVSVNGKPVILGAGSMKQPVAEKPSAQPAAVSPKPKATMSDTVAKTYPHAGYETVQGAIDGAGRGDQKAIEYVRQIQNSGLPIQQREQIKNILSGK